MSAIDWSPSERKLRDFGVIGAVFCALIAGIVWWRQDVTPAVWVLLTLGGSLGLLGIAWPDTLRYVYLGLTILTFPIGWLISQLILMVIWFGVFTPIALFFRLIGRDALQRKLDPTATTYWQSRRAASTPEQYLRQF